MTITFKNANVFNNNSHSSFLQIPSQTQIMHYYKPIYKSYKNIKHNKHANTYDTTAVSKEMQYHISLHSIAGEE